MATCTKTEVVKVPNYNYTLTLSHNEALALFHVLRNVGGCPDKSRRRYTRQIRMSLSGEGFEGYGDDTRGSIEFEKDLT